MTGEPDSDGDTAALAAVDSIFEGISLARAKEASIAERDRLGLGTLGHPALVYGEIDAATLGKVLRRVREDFGGRIDGGHFVDLGSGSGRAVIAAALLQRSWKTCTGIELLEGLHALSLEAAEAYGAVAQTLPSGGPAPDVRFLCGDFVGQEVRGGVIRSDEALDWAGADVVFANSTAFDAGLMRKVASRASRLAKGAIFITVSQELSSPAFELLSALKEEMSWGTATINVHRKTTDAQRLLHVAPAADASPPSMNLTLRDLHRDRMARRAPRIEVLSSTDEQP